MEHWQASVVHIQDPTEEQRVIVRSNCTCQWKRTQPCGDHDVMCDVKRLVAVQVAILVWRSMTNFENVLGDIDGVSLALTHRHLGDLGDAATRVPLLLLQWSHISGRRSLR